MPTWLSENYVTVLVILGLLALGLVFGYWTSRKRAFLIGLGVVAVLALLAWLISVFIVTDNQQIQASLKAMARGVSARDTEAIFKHVAKDFHIGGLDKEGLRKLADSVLHDGQLTEVVMWDFDQAEVAPSRASAKITFMVKPKGSRNPQDMFYRCDATFVREADGKWRISGFELRDPVNNQTLVIPDVQR
jgi:hypothetical protein